MKIDISELNGYSETVGVLGFGVNTGEIIARYATAWFDVILLRASMLFNNNFLILKKV